MFTLTLGYNPGKDAGYNPGGGFAWDEFFVEQATNNMATMSVNKSLGV
jgi:hypothetical protein